MKCPKCGQSLPDDSVFCQFCGFTLGFDEHNNPPASPDQTIDYEGMASADSSSSNIKKEKRERLKISTIVLSALLLLSLGINTFLFVETQTLQKEKLSLDLDRSSLSELLSQKDDEIQTHQDRIKELDKTVRDQQETIASQEQKCRDYNYLFKYFRQSYLFYNVNRTTVCNQLGYSSANFHVNTSVLSMNKGGQDTIKLTAYWPQGGTVLISTSSFSGSKRPISYRFCQNNWSTDVDLELTANNTGIQVLTFTNTVDFQAFDVIVIVK